SGIPTYSLYGDHLAPPLEWLADLDVIVCDLQDIGCRFYTYAWTLVKLMERAAEAQIAIILTDRPNPIGGVTIEGPGVLADHRSLVGLHDVPMRHGLTLGELAQLVNQEMQLGCELQVVPCVGWQREDLWGATGLPWAAPSPNMPTAETALVYPGTCLLEGCNLSVGRGTAKPFEWLGAPWIDGARLARALNQQGLPGVRWRPVAFQPCAAPYAGELCGGVQLHVREPDLVRPVLTGVALLTTLQEFYPEHFAIAHPPHFDRLAGSAELRQSIMRGVTAIDIADRWQSNEQTFRKRIESITIYHQD
ncbi:MAG: DUF1343 domain-containing protein, partial [Chloroflexota bacterium]